MNTKPKAIFFDWFGTLTHSEILSHIADKNHPLNSQTKKISDYIYIHKNTLMTDLLKGNITLREYCDNMARGLGISGWELLSEFSIGFSNIKWADPLIPKFLKSIRENGIKTVLINNVSQAFRKYTVPALELDKYFDGILLSYELKCLKYDTSFEDLLMFQGFLETHRIKYEECLVMDDSPNEKVLKIFDIPYEVIKDNNSLLAIMKKYIR